MNQVQKKRQLVPANLSLNDGIDPFGQNVYASLSYKRVERIVVALNIITNKLPEGDVTRCAIRELAHALLKDTLVLRDGFQSVGTDAVNVVVSHIRLALSYIDILQVRGVLSDTNAEVIKNACGRFVTLLTTAEHARFAESVEFTDDYFGGQEGERVPEKTERSTPQVVARKDVVSDTRFVRSAETIKEKHLPQRDTYIPVTTGAHTPAESSHSIGGTPHLPESAHRRAGILAVIDARGKATVKDIATVVTGCSEKTIQRELNTMIAEGVLRKVGERRWTTYFKAS